MFRIFRYLRTCALNMFLENINYPRIRIIVNLDDWSRTLWWFKFYYTYVVEFAFLLFIRMKIKGMPFKIILMILKSFKKMTSWGMSFHHSWLHFWIFYCTLNIFLCLIYLGDLVYVVHSIYSFS